MDVFGVLTLVGGLALFLFGMNVMGGALEKKAGNRLQSILERLTSNPFKGFLLGALVTAIIQSSSATTVMVIGFVNSGLIKLGQAVGVIIGSNVGTTITSWILSLANLQGDSFIVRLFKPTTFTPVLALIGIILYMMPKAGKKKDTGTILLGFAVLMFGMSTMSGAVEPLADVPEFTRILVLFQNPILGVLMGAVLTAVIQSSSASVGILQALSVTGAITFGNAVPIILGQNIGTCVTALLSSVGANKNAKRAAMVHFYFNVIGGMAFLALFYLFKWLFPLPMLGEAIGGLQIAVVHTAFNLLSTLIFLPFTGVLEKLACLTIPDHKEQSAEKITLLDERLLGTPALAIARSRDLTVQMANAARTNLLAALEMVSDYSEEQAALMNEREEQIDKYEDILGTYLVRLSSRNLTQQDSREISKLLHTIGDFERIGDHAINLIKTAQEIDRKQVSFSPEGTKELSLLKQVLHDILDLTVDSFEKDDLQTAYKVEPLEQVVDDLTRDIRSRHIKRLQEGDCTIELGFILSDLLTNYERVADHCSNIAVAVIEVTQGSFDTHEYLNNVKEGSEDFSRRYQAYKAKYHL